MRRCPHQSSPVPFSLGGFAIDTLILLAFGVATIGILAVAIYRMISLRRRTRDEARAAGYPSGEMPRTEEQKARDGQTAKIWGCLVLLVPCALVLLYVVSR
ncbi:MAG: hypothetical protein ACTH2N_11985 [Brachybacterium tyrofermentans]